MSDRQQLIKQFLDKNNHAKAEVSLLAGDASFRKYYRLKTGGKTYVLMDAPPPHEKIEPFVKIGKYLRSIGLNAPEILAEDYNDGFLLLEDLNDDRYTRILNGTSALINKPSELSLYKLAIDALIKLQKSPVIKDLPTYNDELLMRELLLFTDWYLPILYGKDTAEKLREEYIKLWRELLPYIHVKPEVVVLRDYHADNLMWLPEFNDEKRVGLLDFQDAVIGSPAYDLVSLIEDARRDVSPKLAKQMIDYYLSKADFVNKDEFLTSYALLGAQRNLKIVGIFARLAIRDHKPAYLPYLPRVWEHINNDLKFSKLGKLSNWLEKIVPVEKRKEVPSL